MSGDKQAKWYLCEVTDIVLCQSPEPDARNQIRHRARAITLGSKRRESRGSNRYIEMEQWVDLHGDLISKYGTHKAIISAFDVRSIWAPQAPVPDIQFRRRW